ncbi:MAG: CHASE4 domain-containing protein [Candidatus Thermoplasmatota archaeon]|nr:CHASE4 domain-containing protein [Candidatus Thermoplasmatota archaeon]
MKLKGKTLLIIMVVLAAFLLTTVIVFNTVFMDSFLELEQEDASRNANRASNAIAQEIDALDVLTRDWASWDDTYAFVEDGNENYATANLVDTTFAGAGLNLILIVNASDGIVFGVAFDLDNETSLPVPQDMLDMIESGGILLRHENISSGIKGILLTASGPMMISSRPILTSENGGPSRGSLIMARYMDGKFVERLGETTQLSLSIVSVNDPEIPSDFQNALQHIEAEGGIFIERFSGNSLGAYAAENDIYGNTAVVIRADIPRTIYSQGQATILFSSILIILACTVLGLMMFVLLQISVIGRLSVLGGELDKIGEEGILSARIHTKGNDELALLGNNINKMLANLENFQAIIAEERENVQRTETELQAVKRISEMKSQFISNATHELRIPLVSIKGYVDLVRTGKYGKLPDKAAEFLTVAKNNTDRLLHLTDDLLDVHRVESGKLGLDIQDIDVGAVIRQCIEELKPLTDEKKQTIEVDMPKKQLPIKADLQRLGQVVSELLTNAYKFTPKKGRITIKVNDMKDRMEIAISDTGMGIDKNNLQKIFEPFADIKRPTTFQSTGLGLNVAKGIVEGHGGKISAESGGDGKGTTFTIILPRIK